ncbi:hypothetical protein LS71_000310 [Helicobacter jaachi]|uniref:Uncharacterized protein n=1 Tax=Helicobacter jaachi TaxID=1677920 RepID=A0A4V6I2R9_9HELI|nr:hypothetical protein [Helicobacter jaachi]TLD97242.1 hypothetical protein LS71_000310 [Helicobacter jaachi]
MSAARIWQAKRNGFYIIYAVLFIVSMGIACAFYVRESHHRSFTHASLHAKVQLHLYARSLKEMNILCLKARDFHTCERQAFLFPNGYHFRTALTSLTANTILLDIHGNVTHPSSTNITRITKRYILITP